MFAVAFLFIFFFLWLFSGRVVQFETYAISFIYAALCSSVLAVVMKRSVVRKFLQEIRVSVFWALLLSAVLMHSLLTSQSLSILDLVLLTLVCFWAGLILVDIESIVVGSFFALGLCTLIMFVEFSIPAFLGVLSHAEFNEIVYYQAIRMIFTAIFPVPVILCLVAGILGGYFGERVFASV